MKQFLSLLTFALLMNIFQNQECISVPSLEQPVALYNEVIQQMVSTLDFTNSYGDIETIDVLFDPTSDKYQFIFRQVVGDSTIYTGAITQFNQKNKQHIVIKFVRSYEKDDIFLLFGYKFDNSTKPLNCPNQKKTFTNNFGNYALLFIRKFQNPNIKPAPT